ncbi:hypothetical protein AMR76_21725 [Vibrio furnissii]|uniref:Uncharacterized protein n=1 Tax=Vibrio furnissii TaxID=29494 RepID=A0A0Q2UST0_VIBFU|nr:ETEC_3214 domain-containing protein [Vibrio furnissii]KQH83632.1 hypothetical protein AMR76_21725 [Vibrio furnissii]
MSDIEHTLEPAAPPRSLKERSLKEQWGRLIALVSLVAIALGSFNDSTDALEKIYDFSLAQFTDIPSQDKLNSVYVRASASVLDEHLGAPVYIKRSGAGDVIKYYQDSRFVLSAVIQDEAIAAYLVFPTQGFVPDTSKSAGGQDLLSTPFSAQEGVTDLRAALSRMITYYIEENTAGDFSNLYTSVSGYSEFENSLTEQQRAQFTTLTDELMMGEDVTQSAQALRRTLTPNFYGYSTLGLSALEDAILTKSEFRLIQP